MVGGLKFLQVYPTPALAVLTKLCKFKHRLVRPLDCQNPELQALARKYRSDNNLSTDLGYMRHCLWFGVYFGNRLEAAIGFEENYSKHDGLWLYVVDTLVADYPGAKRSYSTLWRFIANIPFRIRGVVHVSNGAFKTVMERRGCELIGWVLEKKA